MSLKNGHVDAALATAQYKVGISSAIRRILVPYKLDKVVFPVWASASRSLMQASGKMVIN